MKEMVEKQNSRGLTPSSWAALTHLAAFSGYAIPLGNVLGPLVVWILKKDEEELVNQHGKEAINFQISVCIYYVISALLMLILIGFVLFGIVFLFQIICTILAALKAKNDEFFKYPLTIRFLK